MSQQKVDREDPVENDKADDSAAPALKNDRNDIFKTAAMEPLEIEKAEPKDASAGQAKMCCLETRAIGVTRANLTVMMLFYFMNSLNGFINSFNVFFIEESLGVGKEEVDDVQQTNRIIGYIFQLPIVLSIGVVYDIYGRRKPFLLAWAFAAIATFVYPFVTDKVLYYIVSTLLVPLTACFTIPFVPDLIMEASQPLAVFFTIISIASGKVVVAGLLDVVASKTMGVSYTAVYIGISVLAAAYTILAYLFMKDVVKSDEFKVRRAATGTHKSSQRGLHVLEQGFKLIIHTPQILFGILGLTQADLILNVCTGTTTQALIQKYTKACPLPVQKKCAADAESRAQAYTSQVLQLAILLGIPFAYATSKFAKSKRINQVFLLYSFCILLTGVNTLNVYENVGGIPFLISDVLFATFDLSTGVLCQSMIFTKLMPDSRGVVSSILLVSTTVFGIAQAVLTINIQAGYDEVVDGKKTTNFIKGGQMNVGIIVVTQGCLFLAAALWQCKELISPTPEDPVPEKKEDKKEGDGSFQEVEQY